MNNEQLLKEQFQLLERNLSTKNVLEEKISELKEELSSINDDISLAKQQIIDLTPNIYKFETNRYIVSKRKYSKVIIDNLEEVPKEYVRTKIEPDKSKIKKDGNIPGTHIEENISLVLKEK